MDPHLLYPVLNFPLAPGANPNIAFKRQRRPFNRAFNHLANPTLPIWTGPNCLPASLHGYSRLPILSFSSRPSASGRFFCQSHLSIETIDSAFTDVSDSSLSHLDKPKSSSCCVRAQQSKSPYPEKMFLPPPRSVTWFNRLDKSKPFLTCREGNRRHICLGAPHHTLEFPYSSNRATVFNLDMSKLNLAFPADSRHSTRLCRRS